MRVDRTGGSIRPTDWLECQVAHLHPQPVRSIAQMLLAASSINSPFLLIQLYLLLVVTCRNPPYLPEGSICFEHWWALADPKPQGYFCVIPIQTNQLHFLQKVLSEALDLSRCWLAHLLKYMHIPGQFFMCINFISACSHKMPSMGQTFLCMLTHQPDSISWLCPAKWSNFNIYISEELL